MNNAIPISIGPPVSEPDDLRTLVEIDRRRGSIGLHVASDVTRAALTSSANELLRAVQAWRSHEAAVSWTAVRPAGDVRGAA